MRHRMVSFIAIGVCLFLISFSDCPAAWNYYMPVFKPNPGHWSGLGVTNLSATDIANITITIYGTNGNTLGTQTMTIPAGGQEKGVLGGTLTGEGWIKIISDQPLAGLNFIGRYIGRSTDYYLADVPFTEVASKSLLIPHVAQNPSWDTTVYIANAEASSGEVTLTYTDRTGAAGSPHIVLIYGNGALEVPVHDIAQSSQVYGGYVTITSTRKLSAFALYHNFKTGNDSYAGINAVNMSKEPSCGAYVAPGAWKEFDCYNLGAIGKTTGDIPFAPSWRLIGGYWQWGRKGPDAGQWYHTNTSNFAHGPTGPGGEAAANSVGISGWDTTNAPDGSWLDASKTANDPCPEGFRVPTRSQWDGVRYNNIQTTMGTWVNSSSDYSSARFFGKELMLPAAGFRDSSHYGALQNENNYGFYWSSSQYMSIYAWDLYFLSSGTGTSNHYRRDGRSIRCIAE